MPRSVDPRTWAQVADPTLRQSFRELVDRLEEVRTAERPGFFAYLEADQNFGAAGGSFIVKMTNTLRLSGHPAQQEFFVPPVGSTDTACWRPGRPGIPYIVVAAVRANALRGMESFLDLVDLNTGNSLRRLASYRETPDTPTLAGATLICPEVNQRLALRLYSDAWNGANGLAYGRSGAIRSYFGAFCLQP